MSTTIDSIRDAHAGRLLEYDITGHGPVLFRRPSRGDFKRFVSQISDAKTDKASAMEALVRSCVLHPTGAAFDAILDDMPGLLLQATSDLQTLAGVDSGAITKKE